MPDLLGQSEEFVALLEATSRIPGRRLESCFTRPLFRGLDRNR